MPDTAHNFAGPAASAAAVAPVPPDATAKAGGGVADFSAKFDRVCQVLDKYERKPHKLIAILQEIQEEY